MSKPLRVVGKEMADEQSRKGAAVNHKDARHNYDTAKAKVRRATRGKKSPMKKFAGCMP